MIRRYGPYTVEQIAPSAFAIDNDRDESMYLIRGQSKAVLIDTGSDPHPLADVIRGLWDGPVEVVLTHAHFDHIGQADAFEKVSVHRADLEAWNVLGPEAVLGSLGSGAGWNRYNVKNWHPLEDGDRIDLGDRSLRVILAPGHTPGSILIADDEQQLLLTGDAFGSGSHAWMWMPGCLSVGSYRDSLRNVLKKLEPISGYRMFGGHRRQSIPTAEEPLSGPLTFDTVKDMETLCEKILSGDLQPEKKERNFGFPCLRYRYGRAAIVVMKSKIK